MTAPLRRIVVAVDASTLSLAAAAMACRLSGRLGMPVDAVFVEDINVVRLAAHAQVLTVSLMAARRQAADGALIAKALELQGIAAHRAVEAALEMTGGHGGFALRRGKVEAELLAAGAAGDLLCLGWSGRADPGMRPRLGSVARAVAAASGGSVMLMQNAALGPICLWWDGDARALEMAAALATRDGGAVEVVVPDADHIGGARRGLEAVTRLEEKGQRATLRAVARSAQLLPSLPADALLVLAAGSGVALDDVPCSVTVAR